MGLSLPINRVELARLPANATTEADLTVSDALIADIARDLDLDGLRKLTMSVALEPKGRKDWDLVGRIGATVIQTCVVSLVPVTTRIDAKFERLYRGDGVLPEVAEGGEVEMPEDERVEALPEIVDLEALAVEELALAVPTYPKAHGAEPGNTAVTEPGKPVLTDETAKPFAGLAGLRDKLAGKEDGDAE